MKKILFISLQLLVIINSIYAAPKIALNDLKLPAGFKINVYARVPNAREMALAPNGILFVGTRRAGKVYVVLPNKSHTKAKKVILLAKGLYMPNGVAYHDKDLYIAAVDKLYKIKNVLQHLQNPKLTLINDKFPGHPHHGWRYIKFGPDGKLYMSIGAPCNVCITKDPRFASILRMNADASHQQVYAKGVRNSVGFTWNPNTKNLWFTDNGRDWLGDNIPPDELNIARRAGMDFGFPYYYGNNVPDPKYGKLKSPQGMTPAALDLGPHVAALGIIFYQGKMFPQQYLNQVLIAEHGSWNRSQKIGYRVMLVKVKNNKPISYQPFITGWLQGDSYWGRPVDLLEMPDGSLLISDDFSGTIYRVFL